MDFKALVANRHQYAEDWKKRTGGKVVGWFEPYFPEEIAYAAGLLPVRILAPHEADDVSDKWIYGACYPVRDMTNQFLKGRYDYIDGLVCMEGCQWMYNAFEVVTTNNENLFSHYVFLPDYTDAPTSKQVTRSEFNILKERIEAWTGKPIGDSDLDEAIEIYNKNRFLLRQIYELRRADRPVIGGSEMMNIILADQLMDKAEMNVLLEAFLKEAEERVPGKDKIRLMLIGSETFDTVLEELVEAQGADIVVDELDNGSSYFWNLVIPQKDRLMALALRYLGRPHSALKDNNWRRRPQRIFELAEDYSVDGAIIAKQVYCHSHGSDSYMVWKLLRERGIPYHYFERNNVLSPEETALRIEAFLNMLKPGLTHMSGWHKKFGE
jgi:benzoyl-CoA reductase subunit C